MVLQIAVVGDPGVGKTSLVQTYTTFVFPESIAADTPSEVENEEMIDGEKVTLQLLDGLGNAQVMEKVDAVMICFACDNLDSYRGVKKHVDCFNQRIPKMMIGCKGDTENRAVGSVDFIATDAFEYGCSKYVETQAKNEQNIKIAFTKAAALALAYQKRKVNEKETLRQRTLKVGPTQSQKEAKVARRASIDALQSDLLAKGAGGDGGSSSSRGSGSGPSNKVESSCACTVC